ncbi:MAG: 1-acyl-sn-glycerol-3-phosphate acyltransferase [Rubrobacteridae bacterium]|nr:1-acyl-sn-glycerol-3-phosphate acyltransferase [Rubrobacteridae bacterium]
MFYTFIRLLFAVLFKPLFRYEITGHENIPSDGPLIIAANHRSYLDPIFMAIIVKNRATNFMAKDSLFRYPIFGTIIKNLNAFPVKKGVPDKAALVRSLRTLENKEILVIFPEGTRYLEGGMGPAYPGVTTIALKTGSPILPVGIIGTEKVMPEGVRIPRLPKIRIKIGSLIRVDKVSGPERKAAEEVLTKQMMDEIGKLIAER